MSHSIRLWLVLLAVVLLPYHSSQAAQQFTRSQAFGDWLLHCTENNDPKSKTGEVCSLQQQLLTKEGARLVLISIVKMNDRKEDMAVFVLPLGFYIPDGAKITVDNNKSRNLLVTLCLQAGCEARISLDKKLSDEMSAGSKMKISVVTGDRAKKLEFAVSLKGITDGLKAIR